MALSNQQYGRVLDTLYQTCFRLGDLVGETYIDTVNAARDVTFESLREMHLLAANDVEPILTANSVWDLQQAVQHYDYNVRQSLWPIQRWLSTLMSFLLGHQSACVNIRAGKQYERQIRGVQEYINAIEIELLEVHYGCLMITWRLHGHIEAYDERVRYWASRNLMRATLRRLAVEAMDSNVGVLDDDTLATYRAPQSDVDDRHQTREMRETYNVVQSGRLWCPVTGRYWSRREHEKVPIIPVVYGAENAARLFGKPESQGVEVIYDALNTLPMMDMIAEWFEEFKVTIVPSRYNTDLCLWEFRLVILDWDITDTDIMHEDGDITTEDLHGKELEFRNNERPRMCYLAAHWLMALDLRRFSNLKRYRLDRAVAGVELDDERVPWQHLWTSSGPYLDVGVLRAWVELAGFVNGNDPLPEWLQRIATDHTSVAPTKAKHVAADFRRRALMHAAMDEDEYMLPTEGL